MISAHFACLGVVHSMGQILHNTTGNYFAYGKQTSLEKERAEVKPERIADMISRGGGVHADYRLYVFL